MSNRDELIDKVTAEVMKIYGVKSNNGDDCQKCSTEPSSSSRKPTAISNDIKPTITTNSSSNTKAQTVLVVPSSDSHLKKAIMMVSGNHL